MGDELARKNEGGGRKGVEGELATKSRVRKGKRKVGDEVINKLLEGKAEKGKGGMY